MILKVFAGQSLYNQFPKRIQKVEKKKNTTTETISFSEVLQKAQEK